MVTIKSYTDIEQSRKLAEILPAESADMCWTNHCYGSIRSSMTVSSKTIEEYKELLTRFGDLTSIDVFYPCWSLAALLNILPKEINVQGTIYSINIHTKNKKWFIEYKCNNEEFVGVYSNVFVDACFEMILKLKEKNLL